MKQIVGLLFIAIVTPALAQPRGETWNSLNEGGADVIGFLAILGVIAIFAGFKKSKEEGWKNLGIVGGIVLLNVVFPTLGTVLLVVIAAVVAWEMIKFMLQ